MSITQWEDLDCPMCKGKIFIQTVRLRWKDGSGTSVQPTGYSCLNCRRPANMEEVVKNARDRTVDIKMRELEAERG